RSAAGAAALAAAITGGLSTRADAAAASTIPTNAAMYISAIDGQAYHSDQATISVGQTITLALRVRFRSGATVGGSTDAGTTFSTSPPYGIFKTRNTWSPLATDANKAFAIYGRYVNPVSHASISTTVHVKILPGAVTPPAPSATGSMPLPVGPPVPPA